jgi:hypothetical protein
MKRTLIVFFGFFITLTAFSQRKVTKELVEAFYKTKTCVVLDDNMMSGYNIEIQDVVKKEWNVTPYEFINWAEFDKRRDDPSYSFLILNQVIFETDRTAAKYNFLGLIMGGKERRLVDMPDLCPIPLSYSGIEEEAYLYKLNTFILFMQKHLELIHSNPDMISSNPFKYYTKNLSELNGKTICFVKEDLAKDVNTLDKISKYYKGKVEILTREQLHQKILDKEDIVFLHKVGPQGQKIRGRCYKILMGASDAKLYYFDYHTVVSDKPDGFLDSDLKKLSR